MAGTPPYPRGEAVQGPLQGRVILADDGTTRVAIACLDLMAILAAEATALRERLAAMGGIEPAAVMIAFADPDAAIDGTARSLDPVCRMQVPAPARPDGYDATPTADLQASAHRCASAPARRSAAKSTVISTSSRALNKAGLASSSTPTRTRSAKPTTSPTTGPASSRPACGTTSSTPATATCGSTRSTRCPSIPTRPCTAPKAAAESRRARPLTAIRRRHRGLTELGERLRPFRRRFATPQTQLRLPRWVVSVSWPGRGHARLAGGGAAGSAR